MTVENVRMSIRNIRANGPNIEVVADLLSVSKRTTVAWGRSFGAEEFGPWIHSVLRRVSGSGDCQIRIEGNPGEGIWSITDCDGTLPWFQMSATASGTKRPSEHVRALAFINRLRFPFQKPLDPAAAGWSEDDILVEARRNGWAP